MRKATFAALVVLCMTASAAMTRNASKYNGTWKGAEGGQTRKLTVKDGVVFMEETQPNGRVILRQYPFQGQEITITEGGVDFV